MLIGCNGIDNPEGDLKDVKLEDWPQTDCSTSTRPVRDLVAYQLLGVIPLCTGRPWMKGNEDVVDDFNVRPFANEATLDNNLASLNHALDVVGSRRISQLRSYEDDSSVWSLFLVNRHEVRTQCLILKPDAPKAQ